MNLASIQFPIFKPYKKPAIELYVSGCNNKCNQCCNPELHDFDYGTQIDYNYLTKMFQERDSLFEVISVSGGDLMCQKKNDILNFLSFLDKFNKEKWLFTGKDKEDIPIFVLKGFDFIKTGKFNKFHQREGFPASLNQKVWKKKDWLWEECTDEFIT